MLANPFFDVLDFKILQSSHIGADPLSAVDACQCRLALLLSQLPLALERAEAFHRLAGAEHPFGVGFRASSDCDRISAFPVALLNALLVALVVALLAALLLISVILAWVCGAVGKLFVGHRKIASRTFAET